MYIKLVSIFLIFISLTITTNAQDIIVKVSTGNKTNAINDGYAIATVTGGKSPYRYQWSNPNTPLKDSVSIGLTEGGEYQLTVFDSDGQQVATTFEIPAGNIGERINHGFGFLVDKLASVVLCDIFSLMNLYDNRIFNNDGTPVLNPNGTQKTMNIPFVVLWLICGALFCTVYMRFANIRHFGLAVRLVRGKYDSKSKKSNGEVSRFQALATALSATVGLGNIAGVALAITVGGPGATFWMIVAGLLGMSSKFAECTLGVKYRQVNPNGTISGGGMHYIPAAFKKYGMPKIGKVLGYIFAFFVIGGSMGGGCVLQSNQAFAQMSNVFPSMNGHGVIFGCILAILAGVVIIGGIKSIAKFTSVIVPIMAGIYLLTSIVVIIMNINKLGDAAMLIINGAFNPGAAKGGLLGIIVIGFQRAALSNEAGIGSSAIAHSAVNTDKPVSEGIVALLEPFVDTVIICTMTALVIIFTGMYEQAGTLDGIQLTSAAFASVFDWYPYLLLLSIILFAFSTSISWSYYGLQAFRFLTAGFIKNQKVSTIIFQLVFLSTLIVGAASSGGSVVDLTDIMLLCMAFPNFIVLYMMAKEIRTDLNEYVKEVRASQSETN